MKLSKPQVAELLRRYSLLLGNEPVPKAEGKLKRTCMVLVRRKLLTAGLSLTKIGIEEASMRGDMAVPDGAEEWLEPQLKAALKRQQKIATTLKELGESELEGDAYYAEIEKRAAKLKGGSGG